MLQSGAFNVVIDGQFGSTGKGKVAAWLCKTYRPDFISTTNGPNAGHVAVSGERSFLSKILPASAIHDDIYKPKYVIGAGAIFSVKRLLQEITETGVDRSRVIIHPRAMVVTEEHAAQERATTKHVASTMQGTAAAVVDKMMRREGVKLARDYSELSDMIFDGHLATYCIEQIDQGAKWMHEGSQGYSLGINHGFDYPHCTSRECTASLQLSDMGLPTRQMGNVIMVIRPYPIRVGNVIEDGKQVGYSGDVYPDQKEITWAEVAAAAGAPDEVMKGELTTVTKRLRRVFTFSKMQLKQACLVNGTTHIALNFANYISWKCFQANSPERIPQDVYDFVKMVNAEVADIPGSPPRVAVLGTGPEESHMVRV